MKYNYLASLLLAVLFAFSLTTQADEKYRSHRFSSFQTLPAFNEGDIVFIGNSITNMMNWSEAFGSRQDIHGRGTSGCMTQDILDNLESMIQGNPSKVFLMIGTNDLGTAGNTPEAVAGRIEQIVTRIRTEVPQATVYYQSILPSTIGIRSPQKTVPTNDSVKKWIERQGDEKIVYVDLYSKLANADGSLKNQGNANAESYTFDGLHLTQKGYRIWFDAIKDYVGSDGVFPENTPNVWGGLNYSYGMRVSYFGASPVKSADILLIGDEMINNGEWNELLGSADFKNRGNGWGYPSETVKQVAGSFTDILQSNSDKVTKEAPRAVCLYAGLSDVQAGATADSIFTDYSAAVDSLRAKLPTTPIFVMTVLPFPSGDAAKASVIVSLNEKIRTLANDANNVYLIDTYASTYNDSRDEDCFMGTGNVYLSGLGYARVSQAIANAVNDKLGTSYKALSDKDAKKNLARYQVRTAEYDLPYQAGTQLGQYDETAVESYLNTVKAAYSKIDDDSADLNSILASLKAAEDTLKTKLVLPSAQNAGEGRQFQLSTPNRNDLYLTSNGAGKGVTGTAKNNKKQSRWQILMRADGKCDIRNVKDGSYLSPTAAYNAQISTSETEPTAGWEFSWCNNAGLYIIQSGNVQVNQTFQQGKVFNWSESQAGNDRSDLGCQFRVTDVTDIAADEDTAVTSNEVIVDKDHGELYRDGAVSTGWTSEWRSEDGRVTFSASANNMQWNGINIDARSGIAKSSSYTLQCSDDYLITGFTMSLRTIGTASQSWTIDGKGYTVSSSTDAVNVKWEGQGVRSIPMSLSGDNTGTLITDFKVTLKSLNPTIKVDTENGTLAPDGNSTYFATWTSTSTDPNVVLRTGINSSTGRRYNNMSNDSINLVLYGNKSPFHYEIVSTTDDYVITGYEFDYTCPVVATSVTPDEGGEKVSGTVGTTITHVKASGLNTATTGFTLESGAVKPINVSNFYVYLKAVVETPNDRFVVFDNPSSDGVPYRIPAIASTRNGDLIAVSDYRYSRADIGVVTNGKLDLRFRIKDHATGTWGDVKTLAASRGEGAQTVSFGDPCIVADRTSDRVMVTSCCGNVSFPNGTHDNHQGWARFYSEDGGKTWSDYTDISQQVFDQLDKRSDGNIRCFFIGSGKIEQSTTVKKDQYYRLYCAALVKTGNGTNTNYVFYSDDFGGNWTLLGTPDNAPVPSGADEPKTEELPDGSVLVSSRISGGRYYNIFHFTDVMKGEGYWEQVAESNKSVKGITASTNACNGETLCLPVVRKADGAKTYLLLQSVPFGPSDRSNVGINYKELTDLNDFRTPEMLAKDWDGTFKVTTLSSAYSTMTQDADNHVAFFYEENGASGGYDMVYKNYSVEEITDSAYSYSAMTGADSAAYMVNAIDAYVGNMDGLFGDVVGQYTEEARGMIESAANAYKATPGRDAYANLNKVMAEAPSVEIDPAQTYALRNCARGSVDNPYVMTVGTTCFEGVAEASAPITEARQQFRFVPTSEDGTYLLFNPATKTYFGILGANETVVPFVSDSTLAGLIRVESRHNGWSALNNINHTGSNAYIHLAGDTKRLVPWGDTEPSCWYIIPVSDATGIKVVPASDDKAKTTIYDLSGRRVTAPHAKGAYIVNGKKVTL